LIFKKLNICNILTYKNTFFWEKLKK
jgi:hypothetical protein